MVVSSTADHVRSEQQVANRDSGTKGRATWNGDIESENEKQKRCVCVCVCVVVWHLNMGDPSTVYLVAGAGNFVKTSNTFFDTQMGYWH